VLWDRADTHCLGCNAVLRAGTRCSETGQIHISNRIVAKEVKYSRNVKSHIPHNPLVSSANEAAYQIKTGTKIRDPRIISLLLARNDAG
jgi:hypothetical protein